MRLEASPTKVLAAERNVATVRVAVIVLNVLVYLFLMGRQGTIPWLAYAVIAVALPYGFAVALFRPYQRWPLLMSSVWTSVTDAVLITAWIAGTGGFASPFYLLWYVSLVAIAFRYDHKVTAWVTGLYAALYVGELALLRDLASHTTDVLVRVAYIGFVGALGALFARESSAQATSAEKHAQAEERFRALLEAAPDAMVIVDERGRISLVNGQVESAFGYGRDELLGKSIEILVPERLRGKHVGDREGFFSAPRARPMGAGLELFARRKDGSEFPVEISLSPMKTAEGTLVSAAIRDISERKRQEGQRAAGEQERRELLRLKELDAFKTQFINTAAHELKTPLTPIKLQLHLLKTSPTELSPDQKRSVQILDRNVDRLSTLVQDVLDAARIQAGRLALNKKPIDICPVTGEALDSFREVARGLGVALDASMEGMVAVDADAQRLTQVLYNLLSNALKFTPAGGRVHVSVRREDGECLVRVEDTGLGMTSDQLSRLFRPFSQVHEEVQGAKAGTGLGLYISRGILEEHKGRIWAESRGPGQGSTFAFALPLTTATPVLTHRDEKAKKVDRAADEAVSKRLRELI